MNVHEPKRKFLKGAAEYMVLKMIEANGSLHQGYWSYSDGWSDDRIAREANVDIASVRRRRQQVFGEMRRGSTHSETNTTRIDTLEVGAQGQRVKTHELERRIESIEKAFNLLFTKTGQNGLSDDDRKRLASHFGKPYPSASA